MKVLHVLILALSAACLEARLLNLRQDPNFSPCPVEDPRAYTIHLPHPRDCNMFLRCDHGIPKPERCPAYLHFNSVLQVCDWPKKAGCTLKGAGSVPLIPDVVSEVGNEVENPQQDNQNQEQSIPDGGNADVFIPNEWTQSGSIPGEDVQSAQNSEGVIQNDQPLAAEIPSWQTPDEYLPVNEIDNVYVQNGEKYETPILEDVLDEDIFPETNPE